MISLWEIFLSAGLLIWFMMTAVWLISLLRRDSSIVDIVWGIGFVAAGWLYFALTPPEALVRKWLLMILVTAWGARLSLYILWRNWGEAEDFRYRKWREESGKSWWWISYFKVFMLQGALMWIISMPLLGAQFGSSNPQLSILDYLGAGVWLVGFFFETVGDWQLARFKSKPENRGKLLTSGVWRYTRHPNYFGDAAQWWGFYLIAAAAGAWWSIFSPILMTWLIVKVSGVAMLEESLEKRKPGYESYVRQTNAFFPWFPRS